MLNAFGGVPPIRRFRFADVLLLGRDPVSPMFSVGDLVSPRPHGGDFVSRASIHPLGDTVASLFLFR